MTIKYKQMQGEEFVKKILEGERDFSGIELEANFDLSSYERFKKIQNYLENANLRDNPLIINNSKFEGILAERLYLPNTQGENTDFKDAKFDNTIFPNANFNHANFQNACLYRTNLNHANLESANFEKANFRDTYLQYTNLKRVRNLKKSLNLEYANFMETKVTSKEKPIIEEMFRRLFIVKD